MRNILNCLFLLILPAWVGCHTAGEPAKDAAGDEKDADADPADAGHDADSGDGGENDALLFEIELVESTAAAGASAFAYAQAANPEVGDGTWIPTLTAKDCTYNTPQEPAFCDPACNPGQVCRPDGTCGPPVSRSSAGIITITGLTVGLSLRPVDPTLYYEPVWDPEPADGNLFAGGDPLTAAAAGATVPAFIVSTTGVDSMETALPCPLVLAPGEDLEITWIPGTGDDRVLFSLQSGNHGMQFSSITCAAADSGYLRVDGALIDAFLADFHPTRLWVLRREHEGSAAAGIADVRLRAVSQTVCYQ